MYAFAQPSPSPGQQSGTPAPTQPSTQAPSGPEQGAGGSPFGSVSMLLVMALPLLLLVLMTRSQSKKQKELESSLKVNDKVVTQSGLIGKVTELGERTARIEIAPGVTVVMLKSAIQGPESALPTGKDGDKKEASKDKEAAKEKK
ncbi:MAG: preprotein translocase subunit YajC [Polyangiaceae bacterium]